ncbi:hypothetical protein LPJ64_005751, partial [Coemansia asiatica]
LPLEEPARIPRCSGDSCRKAQMQPTIMLDLETLLLQLLLLLLLLMPVQGSHLSLHPLLLLSLHRCSRVPPGIALVVIVAGRWISATTTIMLVILDSRRLTPCYHRIATTPVYRLEWMPSPTTTTTPPTTTLQIRLLSRGSLKLISRYTRTLSKCARHSAARH